MEQAHIAVYRIFIGHLANKTQKREREAEGGQVRRGTDGIRQGEG